MIDRKQLETLLWIFCILVLAGLSVKMVEDSSRYQCEECTVTLMNQIPTQEIYFEFGTFQIKELFEELTDNGWCTIKWDPSQGYYHNAK